MTEKLETLVDATRAFMDYKPAPRYCATCIFGKDVGSEQGGTPSLYCTHSNLVEFSVGANASCRFHKRRSEAQAEAG